MRHRPSRSESMRHAPSESAPRRPRPPGSPAAPPARRPARRPGPIVSLAGPPTRRGRRVAGGSSRRRSRRRSRPAGPMPLDPARRCSRIELDRRSVHALQGRHSVFSAGGRDSGAVPPEGFESATCFQTPILEHCGIIQSLDGRSNRLRMTRTGGLVARRGRPAGSESARPGPASRASHGTTTGHSDTFGQHTFTRQRPADWSLVKRLICPAAGPLFATPARPRDCAQSRLRLGPGRLGPGRDGPNGPNGLASDGKACRAARPRHVARPAGRSRAAARVPAFRLQAALCQHHPSHGDLGSRV
jgi:hypothetical protein